MFEIKRKERIYEEVQLGDEVLVIDLDPISVLRRYNECAADIAAAKESIERSRKQGVAPTADQLTLYGNAVVALLGVVFGEENAAKIVAHFEGGYTEMLTQVMPYIAGTIAPKIQAAAMELKKANMRKYKPAKLPFLRR